MSNEEYIKGGSFLLPDNWEDDPFIPEDFTEEQLMMAKTTEDFIEKSVLPKIDQVEAKEFEVTRSLIQEGGELGLLSIEVPEKYDGLDLEKTTAMLVNEKIAPAGSFVPAWGAHSGIGMLPIVYFGTEEQKKKYLDKLMSGEWIGSYTLTEANAGSDALSGKAHAVLSEDGKHWILNGEKSFITNAGFADLFIVFAKIDREYFSAFIIEKDFEGFSLGAEEKKMGIKGSSTRTIIMQDLKIPVDNLLGEKGKGHIIAFNILNIGRLKLGAGAIGGSKDALKTAVNYAMERVQFKKPIAEFGMIREKIADMTIKSFVGESMAYRTAGLIDKLLSTIDPDAADAEKQKIKGIEEYQVECSILKVYGSEILDFVVDETLQIHGGYGYIEEYPAEKMYRDSRINRIYEGTNEINRLVITGQLLRRATKGLVPLLPAAQKIVKELTELPPLSSGEEDEFMATEKKMVNNMKKVALMTAGQAGQKFGKDILKHQMVMSAGADIIMESFAAESALLRVLKLKEKNHPNADIAEKLTRAFLYETVGRVEMLGRKIIASLESGDMLRINLSALKRFTRHTPVDVLALKDEIAGIAIEKKGYPFKFSG